MMGTSTWARIWHCMLTKKRPFRFSRRSLSTALWVARRSAVFARLLGFLFAAKAGEIMEELESALESGRDSGVGKGVKGEGR